MKRLGGCWARHDPAIPPRIVPVAEGIIPEEEEEEAEELLIIVSVFIEWDAGDKTKIYDYNYEATKLATRKSSIRSDFTLST